MLGLRLYVYLLFLGKSVAADSPEQGLHYLFVPGREKTYSCWQ